MSLDRYVRLARGARWRRSHGVEGGERAELHGPVRVSAPHLDTTIWLGRTTRLYHQVGLYLDAPGAKISIGDRSYLNRRTEITCKRSVSIGQGCAISWDVLITDTDYHQLDGGDPVAPVLIGDEVWIAAKVVILKGVTIGDGAVIAAGAVVTRDVPARALAAGNPAKVLRDAVTWSL